MKTGDGYRRQRDSDRDGNDTPFDRIHDRVGVGDEDEGSLTQATVIVRATDVGVTVADLAGGQDEETLPVRPSLYRIKLAKVALASMISTGVGSRATVMAAFHP